MTLEEKLQNLPVKPGCYLFKDKKGTVLYVGKAGALRSRVRSYFQESRPYHPKLAALVKRVADLEFIVTDSEVEALILENNLIKEYKPRYNVNLKDDKSYPYIRITNEDFPQVFITRRIIRDGSQYFGPYTDVKNVRSIVKILHRIFPIRSCKYDLSPDVIKKGKVQLCLDYYIKKCKGPCQGLQSKEDYDKMIDGVRRFLKGKTDELLKELRTEMESHARDLEFEEAARVRDKISDLENYRNNQKMVQSDHRDRDVVAMAREDDDACAVLFKIREGKIIGRMHYYMGQVEWQSDGEIISQFINHYYFNSDDLPQEVYLQTEIDQKTAYETWLTERSERKVHLIIPKVGEKRQLMDLGQKNARFLLEELKLQKLKSKNYIPHVVKALQRDLRLKQEPRRIECFDISNIQGTDPVASMVCFVDGKAKKSEYRRFKINVKQSPDDFAMMREVVYRRYSRLIREKKSLPDLIMVDGGKGQLSSAVSVLNELKISDQPIIGLAKRLEEIFFPGYSDAQMLPKTSSSLRLLQQIRDEAHRFAITFHRERRKKRTLTSELDKIAGIGEKRRNQLLKVFGSVKKIREAEISELIEKGKLSGELAKKVKNELNGRRS
ncbi:MAG: excinuclease ABC subunit UvrC [Calditrichaceae bacterium]